MFCHLYPFGYAQGTAYPGPEGTPVIGNDEV